MNIKEDIYEKIIIRITLAGIPLYARCVETV